MWCPRCKCQIQGGKPAKRNQKKEKKEKKDTQEDKEAKEAKEKLRKESADAKKVPWTPNIACTGLHTKKQDDLNTMI